MHCFFCQKNSKDIDFKDVRSLERFLSAAGKIKSRKKTRLCAQHQKRLAQAVKRTRFMSLLPYVKE